MSAARPGQHTERHAQREEVGLSIMRSVLYPSAHPEAGALVPAAALNSGPWRSGAPGHPRVGDKWLRKADMMPAVSPNPLGHDPEVFRTRTPGVHSFVSDHLAANHTELLARYGRR